MVCLEICAQTSLTKKVVESWGLDGDDLSDWRSSYGSESVRTQLSRRSAQYQTILKHLRPDCGELLLEIVGFPAVMSH